MAHQEVIRGRARAHAFKGARPQVGGASMFACGSHTFLWSRAGAWAEAGTGRADCDCVRMRVVEGVSGSLKICVTSCKNLAQR